MVKIVSAAEAAKIIPDGAVVTVSSSSGLCCPDAVLKAIGERFDAEQHPRKLTMMHAIAAGDIYGVRGIDHLAKPGLIARAICGSYPSGPSSSEPPMIWQMLGRNEIAAYNVPSGIMFDMHREAAAKRPGVLTKVGLDTFVDPRREGCAMNAAAAAEPIVKVVQFEGEEWLYFPAINPDVAIISATTADERGNLSFEQEGAYLGALDLAMAAHNTGGKVIAQVKRIAKAGTLKTHDVRVPGILIDYVVEAPDQWQTTQTPYDPAISGEIFRPMESFALMEWGIGKPIARRVAQELKKDWAVNLGFRRFGECAAHLHRGRLAWRGDLGDRAGRGRRRAAARFPVRLLVQCRGDRAVAASVHLLPGFGLRLLATLLPADRQPWIGQCVEARRPAACDGGRGRLRRYYFAGEEDRLFRLLQCRRQDADRRRQARDRPGRQGQEAGARGRAGVVLGAARRRSKARM